jgi:hypothetical protein
MVDKIDPEYLKEVMSRCKAECPEIAEQEYLVWINSIDYILREQGIDGDEEEAKKAYEKAQKEFEKTEYYFEVLPALEEEPEPQGHQLKEIESEA